MTTKMSVVPKPTCSSCKSANSNFWRKDSSGAFICNSCPKSENGSTDDGPTMEAGGSQTRNSYSASGMSEWTLSAHHSSRMASSQYLGPLRKSARIKPSKYKYQSALKTQLTKGKSRRSIFKKNPIKAPTAVSTVVTSEYIFYEGQYWQVGDVVSVMDHGGGVYFAQIRGFLQDQYCAKSAVITWLLPTLSSPPDRFDPATYIIGPDEDVPRSMSSFELEMHAPSSYFHDKNSPYGTETKGPELGFIWTHLGPEIRRVPRPEQLYGLQELDTNDIPSAAVQKGKPKLENERKRKLVGNIRRKGKNGKPAVVAPKGKTAAAIQPDAKLPASKDKTVVAKDKVVPIKEKTVAKEKPIGRETKASKNDRDVKNTTTAVASKVANKDRQSEKAILEPAVVAEGRCRRERRKVQKKDAPSS